MDDGSKCRLLALLKKLLPEFNEILNQVKDGRGFLNFPSGFADWLIADGLPPWSHFYKSKNAFKTLGVRAITDPSYLDELKASGQVLSSNYVNELKEEVIEDVLAGDFFDVSDEELLDSQEAVENWESLLEDKRIHD
ncbi:MAG: hypothetical protein R3F41_04905 [Gammaproteobacteria bacterium]|nr:hypothetical protein [Pseudomonadales bacterium]